MLHHTHRSPPLPRTQHAPTMTSLASTIASLARGHGAITIPPPRNAIDSSEKPWGGAMPKKVIFVFFLLLSD